MRSVLVAVSFGFILFFCSCRNNSQLFISVSPDHSGIRFINKITESDSINPIDLTNIYNGGGVGVGDFNNDGLQDIYFSANMVENKLYLNIGHMKFEDITTTAGVTGDGKWCRGVSVVDINNDGRLDIYVCASLSKDPEKRKNLLYINEGNNKNGVPLFKEMAHSYGLDDTSHTTMASFFDYDNDGDLDVYLVVNEIVPGINPSVFKPKVTDGSFPSTGKLFRNDFDSTLNHPFYTDVSRQAGVTTEGYGHGVNISDINKDGWKDIFVTNDFIANDLLYINNHDGTFTDKAASYLKHTSANGMGQDVIDINNDGLSDIIELDMNPEDNYRKKMMLSPSSYQSFQLNDFFKYQYQYVRNTLQVNQGFRVNGNDSIGDPIFSDAGFYAGISETDWSWTPLVADFDNDGLRDIIVTNGFPKDITDHDFIAYRKEASAVTAVSNTLAQIPEVKLHNYAFQNKGDCRFMDVSESWGLKEVSFSNGAAYADLDNDGDLDVIINNINDYPLLYENTAGIKREDEKHYLTIELKGGKDNIHGLGAWIQVYASLGQQVYEQTPYRGYLSTVQINPYFGLDTATFADSVIVIWPDGKKQKLLHIPADQKVKIAHENAAENYQWLSAGVAVSSLFKDVTDSIGVFYTHFQADQVDFNIQKLLPHKFSEYGPSLAAADLNGDGLDDVVIGGNSSMPAIVYFQQPGGFLHKQEPVKANDPQPGVFQDMGIILIDADNDGDNDMYIAKGGYESAANSAVYNDEFFINDGHGNFMRDSFAVPKNFTSKSCVRAIDYDKDGDLDLFVAGRVEPWSYPKPVSSFIYRNDTRKGHVKFTDVTADVAPGLSRSGLVCDALFTDFDNDGWPDLVLAGEWMSPVFLKNTAGIFKNVTSETGLSGQIGWWNSLCAGDFDNDGDIDYIFGNLGQNSYYKASPEFPVSTYAKDFDNNKSYDAILSQFLPESQQDQAKKEFPSPVRDDLIKQIIGFRSKFQDYKTYAKTEMKNLFNPEQLDQALIIHANNFNSIYCRNDGNGKFSLTPLPFKAQWSSLNGMIVDDFDNDGNLDLVINTNDYGTDVSVGRYDALNGLLLKGDGKGNFLSLSILESGIFIPGNGKGLIKIKTKDNQYCLVASQNRGRLKIFRLKTATRNILLLPDETKADVYYKDGHKNLREFYYGTSFLSQSSRFITVAENVSAIQFFDTRGSSRRLNF